MILVILGSAVVGAVALYLVFRKNPALKADADALTAKVAPKVDEAIDKAKDKLS